MSKPTKKPEGAKPGPPPMRAAPFPPVKAPPRPVRADKPAPAAENQAPQAEPVASAPVATQVVPPAPAKRFIAPSIPLKTSMSARDAKLDSGKRNAEPSKPTQWPKTPPPPARPAPKPTPVVVVEDAAPAVVAPEEAAPPSPPKPEPAPVVAKRYIAPTLPRPVAHKSTAQEDVKKPTIEAAQKGPVTKEAPAAELPPLPKKGFLGRFRRAPEIDEPASEQPPASKSDTHIEPAPPAEAPTAIDSHPQSVDAVPPAPPPAPRPQALSLITKSAAPALVSIEKVAVRPLTPESKPAPPIENRRASAPEKKSKKKAKQDSSEPDKDAVVRRAKSPLPENEKHVGGQRQGFFARLAAAFQGDEIEEVTLEPVKLAEPKKEFAPQAPTKAPPTTTVEPAKAHETIVVLAPAPKPVASKATPSAPSAPTAIKKVLVTGGGGFLGRAIIERLRAAGIVVRSISRGDYPDLRRRGAETIRGDIGDPSALKKACDGCDTVFHVAAMAGVWGPYRAYERVNVIGTRNVLEACKSAGVTRLIYTSSPSVVFTGEDMQGADESAPYARDFHAPYPKTKAIAEQMVLAANCADLATTALRPHLIWGPGDTNLVPRILMRARKLRRIGGVNKKVDSVYIDNAADAHFLAAEKLSPGAPPAGKAYFITNGEPRGVWDLINGILATADLEPVTREVSRSAAMFTAAALEAIYFLFGLDGEPRITRFVARELSTAHWFDIRAAKRDFGFQPKVSLDEGLARLRRWLHTDGIGLLKMLPPPKKRAVSNADDADAAKALPAS